MKFTKMQGTGNDFIIVDNRGLHFSIEKLQAIALQICKRKVSLGADALMVVDHATGQADFQMIFINQDGSVAEMCGNGARCIARYAYENKIAGDKMVIETGAGEVEAWRIDKRLYRIRLNDPQIIDTDVQLSVDGSVYPCTYVELGNPGVPHAVIRYPGLADTDVTYIRPLAKAIRFHKRLPKGANVNFYDLIDEDHMLIKTYERGVEDFTLACGTGCGSTACAAVAKKDVKGPHVKLTAPGGTLCVDVEKEGGAVKHLFLIGDTNMIAQGVITDEDLEI